MNPKEIEDRAQDQALAYMGRLGNEAPTNSFLAYRDCAKKLLPELSLCLEVLERLPHAWDCGGFEAKRPPICTCGRDERITSLRKTLGLT